MTALVAGDVGVTSVLGAVAVEVPAKVLPVAVAFALTPDAAYETGVRLIQASIAAKRDLDSLVIPGERA